MIKCGVIGLGNIGITATLDPNRAKPASHCEGYQFHSSTELVMVCDPDVQNLMNAEVILGSKNKNSKIKYSLHVNDIVSENLDIVSVATPPETHCEIVHKLAGNCKIILCEKPIANSYEDGLKMVDICEKNNTKLIVNYQRRFDPLVSSVDLNVHSVAGFYTNGLYNNGSHLLDLLLFYFGQPDKVVGRKIINKTCPENDFNADLLLEFKNEINVTVQCLELKDMNIFDVFFYGSTGISHLTQFGKRLDVRSIRPCTLFSGYNEPDYDRQKVSFSTDMSFIWSINHAVDCFNGKPNLSDGKDASQVLRILDMIRLN